MTEIYYCPVAGEMEFHPGGGFDTCCHAPQLHEPVLTVVYNSIRQQVAEEIAAALDAVPAEVYPEDIFPPDGTSTDCHSARVMRFAYPAAANIAREIGSKEAGE
jgi:hypothetical protein